MNDAGLTSAPQRLKVAALFDAPLDEVWGYLSNHDNLVEYSGGILQSADIDRTGSGGTNGVGATRECRVGNDRFVERIVFYEAPYAFAYSAYENTWGLEDHLAAVLLIPEGNRTRIEWSVHFNTADPAAAPMMTQNMQGMMRGPMMGFLTRRFGGELLPPDA